MSIALDVPSHALRFASRSSMVLAGAHINQIHSLFRKFEVCGAFFTLFLGFQTAGSRLEGKPRLVSRQVLGLQKL